MAQPNSHPPSIPSEAPTITSDEAQRILRTLHKSDYESERRRIPPWMPQSCEWFLEEPLYQSWKEEQKSSFLWLSGPQGCGKSVLASFLVHELSRETSQRMLPGTVCYFFFDAGNKEQQSPWVSLYAILHQLFVSKTERNGHSHLVGHALPALGTQGQAGASQSNTVWKILTSVMADPQCGNVLCIVDGLSEYPAAIRVPFINSMARFYSDRKMDENKGGLLKIIATTRVLLEPSSLPSKRLEQIKMKSIILTPEKDHQLFVQTRVRQIGSVKGFSEDAQARFINKITGIAHTTFFSISLILDWLENSTVDDPDTLLQSLNFANTDKIISRVYEMSLRKCPHIPTTQRLLHMVLAAAEPLTLEEINMAMTVKCGAEPNYQAVSIETIKMHCGPLLRVVDSRVIFAHQTAREFLIEPAHDKVANTGQWQHSINLVESNKVLAEICVSYLSRPDFSKDSLAMSKDINDSNIELRIKNYTSRHVFLEYAAKHWAEHFVAATEPASLVNLAVLLCDPLSNGFKTWFQVYWTSAYPPFSPPDGITNLMVDSHFGHVSVLERRKRTKSESLDINAKDDRGWTALHWAAQSGKLEIVESLLELKPNLDAETRQNRTAMDFAAGKGYEDIVQILLDKAAKTSPSPIPLDSRTSARIRRTILRSMPAAGIDRVRSLMLISAAREGNEALVRRLLEQGTRPNQINSQGFTALHIAALQNNASIVRLLLEKGRADIDRRSEMGGETALALASQRGHRETVRLLLGRGANTESHDLKGNTPSSGAAASVRGLLERPPIVRGPSLIPRPPSPPPLIPETFPSKDESHPSHDFHATILDLWFQDHEERSQFAKPTVHNLLYGQGPNAIMARFRQEATPSTPTFRWLHLPANNLIWVKDLVSRIYHERISEPGKFRPSHFEAKLKRVDRLFDAGQQYRAPKDSAVHARFFRPSCRGVNIGEGSTAHKSVNPDAKTSKNKRSETKPPSDEGGKDDTASKDNDIVLFMPFLHHETDAGRESIAEAVESASQAELNRKAWKEKEICADKRLIHTYLHEKPFMHVRRTLDQYYYHTMKDTTIRDRDQVVFRWAKKMWPDEDDSVHNILMVDQLWLWVLDGDTVITSFPQKWNRKHSEDDLDVVESLKKHIQLREGRDPLRSAYDLAVLISSFCSEVFFEREDAPEPLNERLQFLEFFDKSIGHVTASETACFDRLANFFKELDNKSREAEGYFIQAMEKEVEDDNIEGPSNLDKPYDVFYNIGEEAALLREIKDVRDELNIITKVFLDQQKALETMHKLVRAKVSFMGKEPSCDILRRIKRHTSDIKEIDDHASRTYEALNHLLDLKQKHANVCEARWTREQAQETAKQSNTIMVFTIVTIIFLPLSFMAAFFALNVIQFPTDPKTGVTALELDYVAKYLLGFSAAVILPFLIIAFNVNRMNRHVGNWFGQFKETRFGTWLAIWILGHLRLLDKERKATLIRRRENKIKKSEQRHRERQSSSSSPASSPPAASFPPPAVSLSEKAVHPVPKPGEILEDGQRINGAKSRVSSGKSLDSAFRRESLGTIDEESLASIPGMSKFRAKTFPFILRNRETGTNGRSFLG